MVHGGHVYIMTNKSNEILYVGVSSELRNRVYKHKTGFYKNSFTYKYNIHKLVYYEGFHFIEDAIVREKQIKAGSRNKKIELIERMNPDWNDLFDELPVD